jgi:hypothetical protein
MARQSDAWADEILGLVEEDLTQGCSLEGEVASYLADLQKGTSILAYWY